MLFARNSSTRKKHIPQKILSPAELKLSWKRKHSRERNASLCVSSIQKHTVQQILAVKNITSSVYWFSKVFPLVPTCASNCCVRESKFTNPESLSLRFANQKLALSTQKVCYQNRKYQPGLKSKCLQEID